MRSMKIVGGCLLLLLVFAPAARAQDPIAKARELYAAAAYEEALTMLDGLAAGKHGAIDTQVVELYRTLCLLAVGRRDEADKAIEGIIAANPLFRPGDDVSPRMRTAFADARQRLLPALIQQQYEQAKAAFDREDFVAAASGFKRVVDTVADPDITQAAAQPPLSDLRTLAAGFHELSVKAVPPPPPPTPPAPAAPQAPRVYSLEDPQVVAPIAIQQELPKYPGRVRPGGMTGVVEVVISEMGLVEAASAVVSLGAAYDELVTTAATRWQYYPARVDGKPVKFRKRIQITVTGQPGVM
jgi:tetratricopeptide (TPR) repeat protein